MRKIISLLLALALSCACCIAEGGERTVTTGVLVDAAMHTLLLECQDGERYYFSKQGGEDTSGLSGGLMIGKVIAVTHDRENNAIAIADGALKETLATVAYREGEKESALMTYFESSLGYSLYYDESLFSHETDTDGADVFAVTTGIENARLRVDAFPDGDFEGILADVKAVMEERGFEVSEMQSDVFGEEATGALGVKGDEREAAFAVSLNDIAYLVRAYCPADALEGLGADMLDMISGMAAIDENGKAPAFVYGPDADYNLLIVNETDARPTPQGLVDTLYEVGAIASPVVIRSCEIDGLDMTIDMSRGFGEMMSSTGTAGEYVMMGSLVNTLLMNFGLETVTVTSMGEVIETGHAIYDSPLQYYD